MDNNKKPYSQDSLLFMPDETEVRRSQWQPVVSHYIDTVLTDTPANFVNLIHRQPDLYRAIKEQEAKLDEFKNCPSVKMYEIMDVLSEWRRLMWRASFENTLTIP